MTALLPKLIDTAFRAREPKLWPAYDGGYLDRSKYVSASEVAGCARQIVYNRMSPTMGDEGYGFAVRGHTAEAWIVEQLRRAHGGEYEFDYIGDDQVSFYLGVQSGTPDGVMFVLDDNAAMLLEFKCVDPRTAWRSLPKKAHVTQCMQNMFLVRECLNLRGTLNSARLLYIDASNYENMVEYTVKYDEGHAKQLTERAEQIMEYATPEEAPPEGVYSGDCKWCRHKSKCSGAVEAKKRETVKQKEMTNVASKFF